MTLKSSGQPLPCRWQCPADTQGEACPESSASSGASPVAPPTTPLLPWGLFHHPASLPGRCTLPAVV